jgi:myo-inositol 2-dehydrogenase / D-chiro-inositol 1-dehydrogenase
MSPLRVACVGTGFIASRHLAALDGFDDVDIVAVADVALDRAQEAAVAYGARAYRDGAELMEQEELDAIWLCVPPFAHGRLEYQAIERALPFFVEKPLANDLQTAVDIAGRLAESGVLAAAGYHWRYLSLVEQAAELLAASPPVLVNGLWLDKTPPVPWWVRRDRSGGQVLEQATHLLDLARLLAGEVDLVTAEEMGVPSPPTSAPPPPPTSAPPPPPPAATAPADALVPAAATATLRFASGAVGTISSTRLLHTRHRVSLEVMGPEYAVELSERSLTDHEIRVSTASGERVERVLENPIAHEDRAFLDAVCGGPQDVRAPYADALRSHALAWAVDLSARENRSVAPGLAADDA